MYEKIALIVSILFAITSSGEVSPVRTEVWDADLSDSRLSSIFSLPSTRNDDTQHFTETKANRKSVFLLAPLSQKRSEQRQPREATRKTKRCSTHLRRNRLSSAKDFARTRDSNVNVHMKNTSRDIPYVSAINTKYSTESPATTSWTEISNEDETLLRALQDRLKNAQESTVYVDSQEETRRCNKFVCYCQEENCVQKSSKTGSSRMLGSSRWIKPESMNHRHENVRPILDASVLRPGSSRWYHGARHDPRILSPFHSILVRAHQKLTHPAFFAPLLHEVPLVAPHMIGKGGKYANFPYRSFESRPDFIIGDNVHRRRRPISHQGLQKYRHSSQENRFDVSTVSTTSAWSNAEAIDSNEENSATEFPTSYRTNYLDGLISPVTESNVELKDIIEINEINAAETLPRLSAAFSTDHVASTIETGTKDYFESYSSSGTVGMDLIDEESPRFVTTPEISYANARTDSETRSELNPYYSETTTMSASMDQSQSFTDLFREKMLSWTNRPEKTENSFDQRMNDFVLTSTASYEYTRQPTEFYEYVQSTERTYEPNEDYDDSNENKLSSVNKYIPMKKLTEQTIDEDLEENTRGGSLGKSKSHATKMLLAQSYDGGSTTENSPAGEKFLCSTISYECNEDVSDLTTTNAIRGNSWTSGLPFSGRVYETTTPRYESTTDRNSKEGTANILMESITGRATLQDLTTAQYSNREKTTDDDGGELEYTTESLVGITESSTKGLPFYDNSLLLSSINRVINNFASSDDLTKTQDLDEDTLRTQGENLLPEILQIPDLGDILSTPRIEDTIVTKVKGVLSNTKSKSNSADGWSCSAIRNALRRLLKSFRGFHRERKLPSMTVEERQFDHGQWRTKLVTLPPVHEDNSGKLSKTSGRLREGISDLLGIPAIASQTDRQIVRNMIVQSLKNSLADNGEGEDDGPEIKDSIILDALNNALQMMKGSKCMRAKNALKKGNENHKHESIHDEGDASIPRKTLTRYENKGDYKMEGNVEQQVSSDVKHFQKNTPVDGSGTRRTTNYQKVKKLKVKKLNNNLRVVTTCESADLMKSGKYEEETMSLTENPLSGATTISSMNAAAFHEETGNVLNSMSTIEDVQQNNEEIQNGESLEHMTSHQRSSKIYQQFAEVSQQRSKVRVPQKITGCATKDTYTTEGTARDNILGEAERVSEQYNETEEPWRTTDSTNDNIQMTIASARSDLRANGLPETLNEKSKVEIETITVLNETTPSISRFAETNTQENTRETSNYAFSRKPSKISYSKPEIPSVPKITRWYDEVATDFDGTTTEMAKQNSFTQVSTTNFHNFPLNGQSDDEATMEEHFPEYDEADPTMMRATNDIDAPPINYYSPNDRILDYVKNHRVDNEDETATAIVSSMRKSSSDHARLSNKATLNKNTAAAANVKHEMKYTLSENAFSRGENTTSDSISPANANDYGSRKSEVTVSSSPMNAGSLPSQRRKFPGDVIKIHEVTTEVQKTYAKTVYFQPRQSDPENDSRINSPVIAYEDTIVASSNDYFDRNSNNNDDSDDSSDKKINNVGDVAIEEEQADKNMISATGPPLEDISDILPVFPSPIVPGDSIEQLQRSQLYYISDGVKLPLEIRRLKDGTYALLISKNICEQILKRKCCVPLQGHVIQSPRPDTRANNVEEDYQSVVQPLSSTTTLRNTLQKLEEETDEKLNVYHLSNYRRKRGLIVDDNSMATVSMPVLDFARKYNLSLDFDEKDMALNELRSSGKIRNFGDSLRQLAEESEYNRLNEKNLNGYSKVEKSGLHEEQNGKVEFQGSTNTRNNNVLRENIESLKKPNLQKSHANASLSTKVKTSKLRKLENKDNDNQRTINQIMDSSNQVSNSISKGTDIFEEHSNFKSDEMKWGDFEILVKKRGEIPEEIKLVKLKRDQGNEQYMEQHNEKNKLNVLKMNVLKNMNERPYRYQRNTNSGPNKGTEIVKKFLYWFKDLFLNK
ncbi:uncharacterized protein LOC116850163 [Odontomachus brunneus]|uniref:uncharacterized protein LOC116850163 n=1 Tax=Odontomachus brunneus TaxID=486640 RepID=UPI0013F25678|nr:uncharacterized protein LOC116850163 [Odontomachus brunneus]